MSEQMKFEKKENSEEIVSAISEAIFSNEVVQWPHYNEKISMPYCDEKGLKTILQAIQAQAGVKIGDDIIYNDGETAKNFSSYYEGFEGDLKSNFDCRVDINMWHSAKDTSPYLGEDKEGNSAIYQDQNDALLVAMMMNVPRQMLKPTKLGNAQAFLIQMQHALKKGEKIIPPEGWSKYIPISVDDNLIGLYMERAKELNPTKNPMFALIFEARFPETFNDQHLLMLEIEKIINNLK